MKLVIDFVEIKKNQERIGTRDPFHKDEKKCKCPFRVIDIRTSAQNRLDFDIDSARS